MSQFPAFIPVTPEVFYSDGGFLAVADHHIEFLKAAAWASPLKRARLCFHSSPSDAQQEMLIVMHQSSYVRPHRHLSRVETFAMVEGSCDALTFDYTGVLDTIVAMTAPKSGGAFFYRMPKCVYNSLISRAEWAVFIETTIGPFDPESSEAAPWAPVESDPEQGHEFLQHSLTNRR